jgi:hypothetical protein
VDLQVAPIEPVVVGDDCLGKLDIVAAQRLERPVEPLKDEIDPSSVVTGQRLPSPPLDNTYTVQRHSAFALLRL